MHASDPRIPLNTIHSRLGRCAWARAWSGWCLGLGLLALTLVLLDRTLALGLDSLLTPWALAVVPVLAALLAWPMARRVGTRDAARAADQSIGSRDLFLTWDAMHGVDAKAGSQGFAPVVNEDSEAAARRLDPRGAVPYRWNRAASWAVGTWAAGVLAVFMLPQWDLLGRHEAERELAKQRGELAQKTEQLRKENEKWQTRSVDAPNSNQVAQVLKATEEALRQAPTQTPEEVRKMLQEQQRDIDSQWRKSSERADALGGKAQREWQKAGREQAREQARRASRDGSGSQGSEDAGEAGRKAAAEKASRMADELERLRREATALEQKAEERAKAEAAGEEQSKEDRAAEVQEMQDRLAAMQKALQDLAQEAGADSELGKTLREAAKLAQQAQQVAKDAPTCEKALEALQQALEAGEMSAQALQQALQDMQALDDAMSACQACGSCSGAGAMAKAGQGQKPGQGGMPSQGASMQSYEEFYQQCMGQGAGNTAAPGLGMGPKPGPGAGGQAPTNDSSKTGFQLERSRTALQAGRLLMDMDKEKASTDGEARAKYAAAVKALQQGVGEAITQEEVPAGYHKAIRQYFDTIPAGATQPPKADPKAGGR